MGLALFPDTLLQFFPSICGCPHLLLHRFVFIWFCLHFPRWDDYGLRSAVHVDGAINDPQRGSKSWSVEIAFPLKHLAYNTSATVPPRNGSYWGINFSRVEWHVTVVNNTYVKVRWKRAVVF